jgi:IS4 transposase
LFVHKEDIAKAQKQALVLAAERELYRRAKELLEKTEDAKIGLWTKQYRSGAITLEQWREHLNEFEKNIQEGETK